MPQCDTLTQGLQELEASGHSTPSVDVPWLLYSSCQCIHPSVFLTQTTLFPRRDPFPSPRLCGHMLAPGARLGLSAAPPHKLTLAPFHPQQDFSQILSLTSSLTFCPQPMFSTPYMVKPMVSKPIFPVQLLSLASCLGTHCPPELSPARGQAAQIAHLFCVSSPFTSCV